jgi:hypothetical protein
MGSVGWLFAEMVRKNRNISVIEATGSIPGTFTIFLMTATQGYSCWSELLHAFSATTLARS